MQISGSRQDTTGLVVNEKVNIRKEYYRSVRNMCFSLFQTGEYYTKSVVDADGSEAPIWTSELALLEGRLAHIYYVKARRDLSQRDKKLAGFKTPKAPLELYRRFLFYKYFVASDRPVLVTEGKTDIIYLRTAMKALGREFPTLVQVEEGQIEIIVRFLNSSTVDQNVLNSGTGFTGMTQIIGAYDSQLKIYRFLPMAHPVIFIVDNDKGGENVLKAADKKSQQDVKPTSTDAFFHIQRNLYLVKITAQCRWELIGNRELFPRRNVKTAIRRKMPRPK